MHPGAELPGLCHGNKYTRPTDTYMAHSAMCTFHPCARSALSSSTCVCELTGAKRMYIMPPCHATGRVYIPCIQSCIGPACNPPTVSCAPNKHLSERVLTKLQGRVASKPVMEPCGRCGPGRPKFTPWPLSLSKRAYLSMFVLIIQGKPLF